MNTTTACPPTDPLVLDLYRRHFDELRHFLGRRLDCPEAGRDAAQEIFLRLLLNPPTAGIQNPRAFLLRSARNFLIDLGRAARGRPQLVVIDEADPGLVDPLADPARIVIARQQLRLLATGIEALPARCREVFFLHRFDALTQGEIADRLGISAKMVEKHLANAMLHLRRLWAKHSA